MQNSKRNIKIQHRYLDKYNWLTYSEKLEVAFCKYFLVLVFVKSGCRGSQTLGSRVLTVFQN